jgi:transposase
MWSLARDDRSWGGNDPPAVAYTYAPGRGAPHAIKLLAGYSGILQIGDYSAYAVTNPARDCGAVTLATQHLHRARWRRLRPRKRGVVTFTQEGVPDR